MIHEINRELGGGFVRKERSREEKNSELSVRCQTSGCFYSGAQALIVLGSEQY